MNRLSRRAFIQRSLIASAAAGAGALPCLAAGASDPKTRKMTIDLVCGAIGVSANQHEAIELAARHGFESVGVDAAYLASLTNDQIAELKGSVKSKGLVFGGAGLPVEFRRDQSRFEEGLKDLPRIAGGMQRSGLDRMSTWLTPCDDKLTYLENFHQHASRLREVAKILKDHNVRLGLEYVGPKTAWSSRRYPFIHTIAEMKELIAEINTGNVGLQLDSWHWWNAGESAADISSLKGSDVIAVDLNDAPAGVPKDQQVDNRRELPCATGVIDLSAFMNALSQIRYDGPIRAEPFNQAVNKMAKDDACAAAAASLKKAFALLN
ncbi:MAG TPA: sugar phosphate isomerase/epimerase family protein [Patescibacteria group bacterium]|nr:sugar phosphate isomerase/epimerase family protein [Patescibacteria group bacterium]